MKISILAKTIAGAAAMATCATAAVVTAAVVTAPAAHAETSPWEDKPMGWTAIGLTPQGRPDARIRVGLASPAGDQVIFGSFPAHSEVRDLSGDARTLMVQVPERHRTQFSFYDTVSRRNVGHVRVTGDVFGARLDRPGNRVLVSTTDSPVWVSYHRTGGDAILLKGISSQHELTESLDGAYVFGINAQNKLQTTDSHTGRTVRAVALPSGFVECNPGRALDDTHISVNCADQNQSGSVFSYDRTTDRFTNLAANLPANATGYTGAWQTKMGLLVGQRNAECGPVPGWVKGSTWTKVNGATDQVRVDTFFADGSEAVGVQGGCGDSSMELVSVPTTFDGDFTPMAGSHTNPGWELTSYDVQDDLQ
ncbi:hypothetical protein ACSDQ9_06980 [Aestuariimicrobium soli]|uniref:hypothetical protein n=1 Tax=Aestuariimicrobium soli TaxID=2035834 RepID=UPI003EBF68C0